MNVNPLKFFGIISLAFFVAGIYPVLFEKVNSFVRKAIYRRNRTYSFAFSSLLFVTGTIS